MPNVHILTEFIQLLDDNIISLTALTVIVDPESRCHTKGARISQLTLSLYLITRCQFKLRNSVMSLIRTLDYIKVALIRHSPERTVDHLTLKLIEREVQRTISH